MAGTQILVVDDDCAIAEGLERVLTGQGYSVTAVGTGRGAISLADDSTALAILDLGLPDIDGIEVCRTLRRAHPQLGILILSARDQELDVVTGLDAGADDYLVKPFSLSELLARVRAHMRRSAEDAGDQELEPLTAGALKLDPGARRAWRGDQELELRPKEFDLLALLVRQRGKAVTRARIMMDVWQTDWLDSTKTLDTHILNLRGKIGDDAITTLRGIGYRLDL